MLYKLEGVKPWAKYERVFVDVQLLADKATQLEEEGWEVKIIPLGGFTLEQYANAVVFECYMQLDLMYGTHDQVCH